jgi:hypothetical protein
MCNIQEIVGFVLSSVFSIVSHFHWLEQTLELTTKSEHYGSINFYGRGYRLCMNAVSQIFLSDFKAIKERKLCNIAFCCHKNPVNQSYKTLFCKLNHFIIAHHFCIAVKWSSLQKKNKHICSKLYL